MNRNVKMWSAPIALALSATLAWADAPQSQPATGAKPASQPAATPPRVPPAMRNMGPMTMPPATLPAPDEWAFTIDGKKVTEGEVAAAYRRMLPAGRDTDQNVAMGLQRERGKFIDFLVGRYLLDAEAEKLKITVTEADLDAQSEQLVQMFIQARGMTREQLAEQNKASTGKTLEETIKQMRPQMEVPALKEKLAKELFKDVPVDEAKVREAYEGHPTYGPQVKASHILIGVESKVPGMRPNLKTASDEEKGAAHKKAEEVLAKAKEPGADFAALAKEYSIDKGSGANGGELGFFPRRNRMVEPFAAAAFALKPGEISGIVESDFGYHIIKVLEIRPATKPFEAVKDELAEELKKGERQQKLATWLDEVKAKAKIEYAPGKAPTSRPAMPPMMRPAPARPAMPPRPTTPAQPVKPPTAGATTTTPPPASQP